MVYVDVKEDSNDERYEGKSLISHVSKNDMRIIDSGCSHDHMIGDISKFYKLEDCDVGFVKLGNDVPCLVNCRGSMILNDKIRCNDTYWVQGL